MLGASPTETSDCHDYRASANTAERSGAEFVTVSRRGRAQLFSKALARVTIPCMFIQYPDFPFSHFFCIFDIAFFLTTCFYRSICFFEVVVFAVQCVPFEDSTFQHSYQLSASALFGSGGAMYVSLYRLRGCVGNGG